MIVPMPVLKRVAAVYMLVPMPLLKRVAAVYMLLLAAGVAGYFLATQFHDPMLEGAALTAWRVFDPLMVAGAVMVLMTAYARKRRLDADRGDQSVHREYLEANGTFYFSAALFLALLWNWFGVEWVEPSNAIALVWILIDVTLPLLLVSTAIRLLREGSAQTG